MSPDQLLYCVLGSSFLALAYTFLKSAWVSKQEVGTEKMAAKDKTRYDAEMKKYIKTRPPPEPKAKKAKAVGASY